MKFRLLSLFAAVTLVAACSGTADRAYDGGMIGGTMTVTRDGVEIRPGTTEDFAVRAPDRIFFDFDKSSISRESLKALQFQADWLKHYSNKKVVVEGHCDERGTREYNLALGERRANSVKDYLVSKGIRSSRIKVISYGKERPAVVGSNESSWSQNRRAVTAVVK
ncbi:MAG: peptidoglycan-associated lipoprotein Pal [Alphaproteobacteria bacterium]|nr:peptidoglycan-associated lipoprotein Pal [Alphaproteobacteria bacterium]